MFCLYGLFSFEKNLIELFGQIEILLLKFQSEFFDLDPFFHFLGFELILLNQGSIIVAIN